MICLTAGYSAPTAGRMTTMPNNIIIGDWNDDFMAPEAYGFGSPTGFPRERSGLFTAADDGLYILALNDAYGRAASEPGADMLSADGMRFTLSSCRQISRVVPAVTANAFPSPPPHDRPRLAAVHEDLRDTESGCNYVRPRDATHQGSPACDSLLLFFGSDAGSPSPKPKVGPKTPGRTGDGRPQKQNLGFSSRITEACGGTAAATLHGYKAQGASSHGIKPANGLEPVRPSSAEVCVRRHF